MAQRDVDDQCGQACDVARSARAVVSGEGEKTLGSLLHAFGANSFAMLLVLLLGVPGLPLPTGGLRPSSSSLRLSSPWT
jgi:hypothetical protein